MGVCVVKCICVVVEGFEHDRGYFARALAEGYEGHAMGVTTTYQII